MLNLGLVLNLAVLYERLDLLILEVFSKLNDSMSVWFHANYKMFEKWFLFFFENVKHWKHWKSNRRLENTNDIYVT